MPVVTNTKIPRVFTEPFDEYEGAACLACRREVDDPSLLLTLNGRFYLLHPACAVDLRDLLTHELKGFREFCRKNEIEVPDPKKELREVLDQLQEQRKRDREESDRAKAQIQESKPASTKEQRQRKREQQKRERERQRVEEENERAGLELWLSEGEVRHEC